VAKAVIASMQSSLMEVVGYAAIPAVGVVLTSGYGALNRAWTGVDTPAGYVPVPQTAINQDLEAQVDKALDYLETKDPAFNRNNHKK